VQPIDGRAIASQHYVLLLAAIFLKITIVLVSLTTSLNWLVPKTMDTDRAEFVAFCTILTSILINFYGLAYGMLLQTVSSSRLYADLFYSLLLSVGRIQFHAPSFL
jgi:hypothetical protein